MRVDRPISFLVFFLLIPSVFGQRPQLDQGATGLALALRRLPVTGSLLHITAHPDDEDNALLVMMRRGRGLRTGLLTLTRGDGGQNEIGSELFQALGIIRTEELMSMHHYDDTRQFFTRAYEFGYSFSVKETLGKWGEEQILDDMVRVIRNFRPQVILILPRGGEGGGQHHQASALLAEKAFHAARDSNRFKKHFEEGLRPWRPRKLYERFRWPTGYLESSIENPPGVLRVATGLHDSILGKTYAQLGTEARSMHKCQGMSRLLTNPGEYLSEWRPVFVDGIESAEPETDLFEGIDTSLMAFAQVIKMDPNRLPFLIPLIEQIELAIRKAEEVFDPRDPGLTTPPVADGLRKLRLLRRQLYASGIGEDGEYEVFFLLQKKEEDFVHTLNLAHQLTLEALVDDGRVTPGQDLELTVVLSNGGSHSVVIESLKAVTIGNWEVIFPNHSKLDGLELRAGEVRTFKIGLQVSSDSQATEPYWSGPKEKVDQFRIVGNDASLPWGRPELRVEVGYRSFGVKSTLRAHAEYRYAGPRFGGEQRHDLMVVPAITLAVQPAVSVISVAAGDRDRWLQVRVTNNGKEPASGQLTLRVPAGWRKEPAVHDLSFEREEETLVKNFRLFPAKNILAGGFQIEAVAKLDGRSYGRGYQVIDYDHIQRRHLYHPARAELWAVDVKLAPEVRVGYIEGVGDYVPEALGQLGVDAQLLGPEELASSELDRFDTIVTGVRAYLVREDLRAYNHRLLKWVERGGTLIVQYNKFEFNGQQGSRRGVATSPFAPFPAQVGRVTDENAPVRVLKPLHPVFTRPNRIGPEDWNGWVQERGLYFLSQKDSRYHDLISTQDPFPYNPGKKLGSLVEARHGKGRWIYVGLGLWRQLSAGVPGSYRLLANLVSLGRGE